MGVDSSAGPHKSTPTDKTCSPKHEVVHIQTDHDDTTYVHIQTSLSMGSLNHVCPENYVPFTRYMG